MSTQENHTTIKERLTQERIRLNLSEVQFAERCARKTHYVEDWESGRESPEAVTLKLMDEIGVDILYVITGRRQVTSSISTQGTPEELEARITRLESRLDETFMQVATLTDMVMTDEETGESA